MDNATDRSISFDGAGHCNYCTDALRRMGHEYRPDAVGAAYLSRMVDRIRAAGKGRAYDCVVGVSGGVDSSYLLYWAFRVGLRALAVHVDDGFDTELAKANIENLCSATGFDMVSVSSPREEYADVLLSFFKASLPNLAMVQDSVLIATLSAAERDHNVQYALTGSNFAHESILERYDLTDSADRRHLLAVHKAFGSRELREIKLDTFWNGYVWMRYFSGVKRIRVLNYLNYQISDVLRELHDFCGYEYYGFKHYESILTRFMQGYYLPEKYGVDKRKSHYSSLIVVGQMSREEGLLRLQENPYISSGLYLEDMGVIADYMGVSLEELRGYIALPAKRHADYPHSFLHRYAPFFRNFRRYLGT